MRNNVSRRPTEVELHPLLLLEVGLLLVAIVAAVVIPRDQLRRSRLWTAIAGALLVLFLGLLVYSWIAQLLHGLTGAPDFYPEILLAAGLYLGGCGIIVIIRWFRVPELRASRSRNESDRAGHG